MYKKEHKMQKEEDSCIRQPLDNFENESILDKHQGTGSLIHIIATLAIYYRRLEVICSVRPSAHLSV